MSGLSTDLAEMIRCYADLVERLQGRPMLEGVELRRQDPDEIRMVADRVELIESRDLEDCLGVEFYFSIEDHELGSHLEVRVGGWVGADRLIDFRDPTLSVLDVITPGDLLRDHEQPQS